MTAGVIQCVNGDVAVSLDGAPLCSGVWSLVPVPEPFDIAGADPVLFGQAFLVGFGLIATAWAAGWCCRTLLSMIR